MDIKDLERINEAIQNSIDNIKDGLTDKKIDLTTIKTELANIEYYNDKIYSVFENCNNSATIDDLQNENNTLKMILSNLLKADYAAQIDLKLNYDIELY